MSREKGEYSTCTAAIGCTACARRSVAEEISESPRYRTLPSLCRMWGAVEQDMDNGQLTWRAPPSRQPFSKKESKLVVHHSYLGCSTYFDRGVPISSLLEKAKLDPSLWQGYNQPSLRADNTNRLFRLPGASTTSQRRTSHIPVCHWLLMVWYQIW